MTAPNPRRFRTFLMGTIAGMLGTAGLDAASAIVGGTDVLWPKSEITKLIVVGIVTGLFVQWRSSTPPPHHH